MVFVNGWEDRDFCECYFEGVDCLCVEVCVFIFEVVVVCVGVVVVDFVVVVWIFVYEGKCGSIMIGIGISMVCLLNLSEYLYEVLGVICGCYNCEGDVLVNFGVLGFKVCFCVEVVVLVCGYEKCLWIWVCGVV